MRKFLLATLAVALLSTPLAAAPGGNAQQNAPPLMQRAQGNYYGNYGYGLGLGFGYDYKPACPHQLSLRLLAGSLRLSALRVSA